MNTYLESNKERFLNELFELIKIPSISAVKEYDNETRKAAIFLKDQFESLGFSECEICETKGHPIVYAEKIIDEKLPTVLVYGHYDVQPVDPIELWDSDPFNPVVKKTEIHPEGAIFARGACDDKGQMFMHIKAIEVLKNTSGIPCNIKLMIEGEEEIGSDNLEIFVKENKEKLKCDVIIVSDTGMIDKNTPSITTGLRGLAYLEVELTGPDRDLHSGHYGGSVSNPLNELAKMIASLHDENNRVTIPNFYDNVVEFSDEEREIFKTAVEINQAWVVEHASMRQDYICQSQSVNLFFPPDVNKADLHNIHMLAWAKNMKTLYYLRSEAISRADNVSNKVKREIIFEQSDCLNCEG